MNLAGFERIERDDRLLDVFPEEVSQRGIELWDTWTQDEVEIVRIHRQSTKNPVTHYVFSRREIEQALLHSHVLDMKKGKRV